jgi:hypothetical protein
VQRKQKRMSEEVSTKRRCFRNHERGMEEGVVLAAGVATSSLEVVDAESAF